VAVGCERADDEQRSSSDSEHGEPPCGNRCGTIGGMERQQVNLRLSPEQLKAIDDRAQRVGLSRNAWVERALKWALEQPTRVRTVETKERI
jgi:hypothetical protein